MSELKIAGLAPAGGSLLFIAAASLPPVKVFAESDPVKKLNFILHAGGRWAVMQLLFAVASWVVALGTGLAAYHFRDVQDSVPAYLAFAAFVSGAALWSWHAYSCAADPKGFAEGTLSSRICRRACTTFSHYSWDRTIWAGLRGHPPPAAADWRSTHLQTPGVRAST